MTIENLSNMLVGFACINLFETFIMIYLICKIYALEKYLQKEGLID